MNIDSLTLKSLFWGNAPAVSPEILRGLYEGDIVTFTPYKVCFDNTEFLINNSQKWRIWFSQLNTPLYNGSYDGGLDGLQICTFKMKSGDLILPCGINHNEFWNMVKGKRFRVVKVTPCYKPNRDNSDVRRMTLGQVYERVHKAILNGNGSLVKTMLVPHGCYDFEEI